MKLLTPLIAGIILGLVAYHMLFRPEVKTEIVETVTEVIDSTYIDLYIDLKMKIDKYENLNDSIDYYQTLYQKELGNTKLVHDSVFVEKPFSAPLRRFTGSKVHLYGLTRYNALVAGQLMDLDINSEFSIPKVTNTIYRDRTVTRTIQEGGSLWFGSALSHDMNLAPMAAYQNKGWQIGYKYELGSNVHSGYIMRRVF